MNAISLDELRSTLGDVLGDEPRVAAAYAYGSRVRGRALPISDLDLAFVLARDAPRDDPLLAERLSARIASALRTAVEIDGHIAEDLPLPVRGRVLTTGVLLVERDPVRRVEFETATRRLYFDFQPLLERDARAGLRARVDLQKVRHLLALHRRYRDYLDDLAGRSDDALRCDFAVVGGVQHYLLLAVETLLDLGSHIISSEGYEPPSSYSDIFRVLRDEGVIDEPLADRLMAMARFRNVLVHLYADVDEAKVLAILRGSLGGRDRVRARLADVTVYRVRSIRYYLTGGCTPARFRGE